MLALVLAAHLALTPEAPVSTPVIRSAPGWQTRPAIASNGVDFFAAWEHRGDVIGSRILHDGTTLDRNLGISLQPTWVYDMRPAVLWNGETWVVVFFSGPQPWPYGAKAVELNRDGEVITERWLATPRDISSIDVAWNGTSYLVVWQEGLSSMRAQFFDRAFAKIGEELTIADAWFEVSVASSGGSFLIAWTHTDGTYARTISSDGVLGATTRIGETAADIEVASNGISYAVFAKEIIAIDGNGTVTARASVPQVAEVAIAASGANWIVSWGWSFQLWAGELDAAMQFVREPVRLPAGKQFPAVAVAGDRALLLFSDFSEHQYLADIRSTFVDEPSTSRLVSSGLMQQEVADAASSASTLGVLWYEGELPGAGLRFGEIAADGTLVHGEGIALADGTNAHLASSGQGFAAASVRSSRVEVDLLPNGPTVVLGDFETGAPLIASDGRDYFVVWTTSGSTVVGRRVSPDGTLGELHTFPHVLLGAAHLAQDIVWAGTKYVVLTYESIGSRVKTYSVTGTEVSATGEPGPPIVLESGTTFYPGFSGHLAWNGETLLYARSTYQPLQGIRARLGLHGTDFVVLDGYADLHDVVWDDGQWLYAVSQNGTRLLRGEDSVPLETVAAPRLVQGPRTAVVTTRLIERIPNHADQSVRRVFVQFTKQIARRRAVR